LKSITLSEVSQVQKPKATCFLSYVEYRPITNIRNIIYTCKYIQNIYPKVELAEETKGGGKEGNKDSKQ
jgi:hypothetical protein